MVDIFWGLFIPFLGTSLGAACVFFMRGEMNRGVQRGLTGFAAGVMVAASIWSLLIPALDECEAMGRWKSFAGGVLSGIVEPIGGIATILLTAMLVPMMPYLLSFAAGAMLYVVVEELIPEMSAGEHSDVGVISFAIGFMLMMALDVALG